jgi:hypothetical protein
LWNTDIYKFSRFRNKLRHLFVIMKIIGAIAFPFPCNRRRESDTVTDKI